MYEFLSDAQTVLKVNLVRNGIQADMYVIHSYFMRHISNNTLPDLMLLSP